VSGEESIEVSIVGDIEEMVEGRGLCRWRLKDSAPPSKRKPIPHTGRFILFNVYNPKLACTL
jgi:hypothetical protein